MNSLQETNNDGSEKVTKLQEIKMKRKRKTEREDA